MNFGMNLENHYLILFKINLSPFYANTGIFKQFIELGIRSSKSLHIKAAISKIIAH